jgi:hypothetical protein
MAASAEPRDLTTESADAPQPHATERSVLLPHFDTDGLTSMSGRRAASRGEKSAPLPDASPASRPEARRHDAVAASSQPAPERGAEARSAEPPKAAASNTKVRAVVASERGLPARATTAPSPDALAPRQEPLRTPPLPKVSVVESRIRKPLAIPFIPDRRAPQVDREPDVIISIGRIDVRAPAGHDRPSRATSTGKAADVERLEQYVQDRLRGRSA